MHFLLPRSSLVFPLPADVLWAPVQLPGRPSKEVLSTRGQSLRSAEAQAADIHSTNAQSLKIQEVTNPIPELADENRGN